MTTLDGSIDLDFYSIQIDIDAIEVRDYNQDYGRDTVEVTAEDKKEPSRRLPDIVTVKLDKSSRRARQLWRKNKLFKSA